MSCHIPTAFFRACRSLSLLVLVLVTGQGLLAQGVSLQFLPSAFEVSACPGAQLEVTLRLSNPNGADVAGYQAFLRFPAQFFEPIRFESLAVDAFLQVGGPVPLGEGYRACVDGEADPWGDGAGEDVVSVAATTFGDGGSGPVRDASLDLGRFIFRPRGLATDASGGRFSSNETICHVPLEQVSEVFGPGGQSLLSSVPAGFSIVVTDAGPSIPNFSCVDAGESVALSWGVPVGGEVTGYRVYRNGAPLASLPIRSIFNFDDSAPPEGTVRYELAVILPGSVEGCRSSCTVERGTGFRFVRGDANRDTKVSIADGSTILSHLFGGIPLVCLDAGDVDDTGTVTLTDAVSLLDHLFRSGAAPPPPTVASGPGLDPTPDGIGCEG